MSNPLENYSDEKLSEAAYAGALARPGSIEVEMIRRLRTSLEKQTASSNTLGGKIWWLNVWLLVVTVAIGALTVVQVLVALKVIAR